MAALAALALAGCLTDQVVERPPGRGIAEVSETDPRAAQANIESLSDVIRRNPSSPEAYNTRGSAYARLGHFQEAVDDFTQAIRLDPNNFTAYTNRALAYRQSSRNDLARVDFDRAISANPNHAPAYIGRANLLRAQGNLDQARADLDTAIKLNPENAQAFHARGLINQKQGDNIRAVTDFDNAIDRDPFAAAPYQARGESLVTIGKYDKAIEDFNAALNVDSKSAMTWAWLGLAYDRAGNRGKAQESYQRALSLDPSQPIAKQGLARLELVTSPARAKTTSFAVSVCTTSLFWLKVVVLQITFPRSGRESEGEIFSTSLSMRRLSPGRTGRGQASSPPAPITPSAKGAPPSISSRMVSAAVSQPLAISPPNMLDLAASGSVWKYCGSYWRAKRSISSASMVRGPAR